MHTEPAGHRFAYSVMIDNQPPQQPDQNLPVPVQGTTAVGRPMGSGRTPPLQSWQSGEPEAIPWDQYIDAIRRRWWVVVLVSAIGIAAAKYFTKQIPAEYQTTTRIFISGTRSEQGAVRAPNVLTMTTLRDLVTNPSITMPVVRELGLNVSFKQADSTVFRGFSYDSVFTPGAYRLTIDSTASGYTLARMSGGEAVATETGAVGDSVGRQFGFFWQPSPTLLRPKQVVEFRVSDVHNRAMGLAGQLTTDLDQEGGQFLTLTLTGSNPRTIAPILNAWAQRFISVATDLKRLEIVRFKDIVQRQTEQARASMDAAERAYREYSLENVFAPTADGAGGTATVAAQQAQLDQIRRDKARLSEILADKDRTGTIDDSKFGLMPGILSSYPRLNTALQEMVSAQQQLAQDRKVYTDSAPEVKRDLARLSAVVDTQIPNLIRGIQTNLSETEKTVDASLGTSRTQVGGIPVRAIELARRQRALNDAIALYTTVNNQNQQLHLTDEQTQSGDLVVMGAATDPPGPSSSKGPRLFFMAAVGSIGAGLALALLLDRLDRRFRYPQQATMELGLTIAGTIPFFKPNRKGELNLTASAQVVESFRTLRLATQFHFPEGEPVVVCISSPGPGEGKSLVASNLAVAFANAGQKTLLIDGDVRRGVVHTTFEAERRPGLVDYLGGTATSAQITRPTSTDNLYIVPSGSRSRRAPELLVSDRMATLVAEMRSLYQVVIVDSAPFVAGMDAFALGAAAGTLLVVLRPGVTDRKLAENKLEIIDRLPINVIGAVLNAISSGRAYRYYSEYATYEGEMDADETDFDGPSTPPTRLIGKR